MDGWGGLSSRARPLTTTPLTTTPHIPWRRKLHLHGAAVDLECLVEGPIRAIEHLLLPHFVPDSGNGIALNRGVVRPYNDAEIRRSVSPHARRLPGAAIDGAGELYQDAERIWLTDERWGMAEINLIRGTWRSWVLPQPAIDPLRLAEGAVIWPMAQLVRRFDVHVAPVPSVIRRGWGVLMVAPFELGRELRTLVHNGYKLVGQRWTGLREQQRGPDLGVELLHMHGAIEHRPPGPPTTAMLRRPAADAQWLDLEAEFPGCGQPKARCDAVVIVEQGGRRGVGRVDHLPPNEALDALKAAWPLIDLHPSSKLTGLLALLAARCQCVRVQLPLDPAAFLGILDTIRVAGRMGEISSTPHGRWRYTRPVSSRRPSAA